MDRRTVSHLRVRLLWLGAWAFVGCGSPVSSGPSTVNSSAEPRRLQLPETAQSLRPIEPQLVTQAAYPAGSAPVYQPSAVPPSPAVAPPNSLNGPMLVQPQSPVAGGLFGPASQPGYSPTEPGRYAPPVVGDGRLTPVDEDAPAAGAFVPGYPRTADAASPPLVAGGPSLAALSARSAGMAAVNRRAEQLANQACSLAERGALFSARSQFIEALRIVAEALDMERVTDEHSRALSSGLTALREVRDFKPRRSAAEHGMDLAPLVAAHHTPVFKQTGCEGLTPVVAQQRYLTYARQQLEAAGGQQPGASFALYGLGRVAALAGRPEGSPALGDAGQAMAFYQAALGADARNYRAANELGVLLGESDRWDVARDTWVAISKFGGVPVK